MRSDETGLLHRRVRSVLCARIFEGQYADGERLPPERDLAVELGLSRVTIRTALGALEADGLLRRRQGHGTRLTLRTGGYPSPLELVAVLAPLQNDFFSTFLRGFEVAAEKNGALVVVKQVTAHRPMEPVLFELFARGIRDAVIWPQEELLQAEPMRRLRGLGMNLVLFDQAPGLPSADSVSLDNADAVAALLRRLRERGSRSPCLLSWDQPHMASNAEREAAFTALAGAHRLSRLPWPSSHDLLRQVAGALARLPGGTDGILGGNGEIGLAAQQAVRAAGLSLPVVTIDDPPGAAAAGLEGYAQPIGEMAQAAWHCLSAQGKAAERWRSHALRLKGELRRRVAPVAASAGAAAPRRATGRRGG